MSSSFRRRLTLFCIRAKQEAAIFLPDRAQPDRAGITLTTSVGNYQPLPYVLSVGLRRVYGFYSDHRTASLATSCGSLWINSGSRVVTASLVVRSRIAK